MASEFAGSDITMVPATVEEAVEVSSLLREAADWLATRGEALWGPDAVSPEAVRPAIARGEFYLAKINAVTVGAMILQWEDRKFWPDVAQNEAAYIHKLAVRRSIAGQGVSGRMIAWAKGRAVAAGRRFLRLDCALRPRLQAFYEGQGFVAHSERDMGPFSVMRYEMTLLNEVTMKKQAIYTESGPLQGAPYTPAVRVGPWVFVSGQIPLDPASGQVVEGGFEAQVRQCLRNLAGILKQEGLGLEHVVKTTIFMKDLNNFGELNKIYGPYFGGVRPARSTVEVARLPLDVMVEIEAIAVAPE